MLQLTLALSPLVCLAAASVIQSDPSVVKLDEGVFTGTTSGNVTAFLGIPYVHPPARFARAEPISWYTGVYNASAYGPICYQQQFNVNITQDIPEATRQFFDAMLGSTPSGLQSEDCLSINVIRPAGVDTRSKLSVVVYIYGGGFTVGTSETFDGPSIVSKSIEMGEPVIYVSMNYRVSALGFLASKEVKEAGVSNLGLRDQREALRWIQKYISSFGGDPEKVIVLGESAGAASIALHMVMDGADREKLFRGSFMQSGSVPPVGDITGGQSDQDELAARVGCSGANDVLQCLRDVEFDKLRSAMDASTSCLGYNAFNFAWLPRSDGDLFGGPLQSLVTQGKVYNVPFVSSNIKDEGTLFTMASLNLTTDEDFTKYITTNYFPKASTEEIERLKELYPADPAQGSPFDTGAANAFTPVFKRLSALQGDLFFQAPRRYLMQAQSPRQNIWSYSWERSSGIPLIGSYHSSDIVPTFGGQLTPFVVNFANNLDPNGKNGSALWPKYTAGSPTMLAFVGNATDSELSTVQDDFRKEAMEYLTELLIKYPLQHY